MSMTFSLPGIPSTIFVGVEHASYVECAEVQWSCACSYADGPGVNLSNANAWRVLGALGIAQDYSGSIDVEDLTGRILAAQAVGPRATLDVADPASRALLAALSGPVGHAGPTITDCSPELADLLARALPALAGLCDQARSLGVGTIEWC